MGAHVLTAGVAEAPPSLGGVDEGRQVVERMELLRPPEKPLTAAPVHRERHEEILEAGLSILRHVLRRGR